MPKKGEKARKLRALSKGEGVRPPKKWFDKMKKEISNEYSAFGQKRIGRLVGGIWSNMSTSSKKKIVKEYQK